MMSQLVDWHWSLSSWTCAMAAFLVLHGHSLRFRGVFSGIVFFLGGEIMLIYTQPVLKLI